VGYGAEMIWHTMLLQVRLFSRSTAKCGHFECCRVKHQFSCNLRNYQDLDKGADHEAIVPQLQDVYYQAYCSQPGTKLGRAQFNRILEYDLDLNAQGLAVWAAHQRTAGA
jgi:hypothetical protein